MRRPLAAALVALLVVACSTAPPPAAPFTGVTVTVVAIGLAFQPNEVKLPAGQPLRIILDNKDAGVPHNIHVFQGDTDLGRSATVTGPGQTEVRFGPLAAGTYQFACEVHPSMLGTITVGP